MIRSISDEGIHRIAQSVDKDAGFFGDLGRGVRDMALGKPDYGTWSQQLVEKLEQLGLSAFDMDKKDMIWWYEDGYSIDEAVQLAFGGV